MTEREIDAELEYQADKLIGRANRHDEYPAYIEERLDGHRRREWSNYEIYPSLLQLAKQELDESPAHDLQELARFAGLADTELSILQLSLPPHGLSQREIAEGFQCSAMTVGRMLKHARETLTSVMVDCPWWGWLQVYWSEVNRN
jgi:DNA-directed RNA polymerase specialized sigma subunit